MIRAAGGVFVADLDPSDMTLACPDIPEAQANARLIAAAPELLKACKMTLPALETLMDEVTGKRATDWGKVNDAAVTVGRAIAKAEGKE
jgi:hypothetical protein